MGDFHFYKVQRLQNRAARIILDNYDFSINSSQLVTELGWLNVRQRRDYFTSILVYKSLNGLLPAYMSDMFSFVRDFNERPTRSAFTNNLYIPKVNKTLFRQSLLVNGPVIWNSLPNAIQEARTLNVFKFNLKKFILQ